MRSRVASVAVAAVLTGSPCAAQQFHLALGGGLAAGLGATGQFAPAGPLAYAEAGWRPAASRPGAVLRIEHARLAADPLTTLVDDARRSTTAITLGAEFRPARRLLPPFDARLTLGAVAFRDGGFVLGGASAAVPGRLGSQAWAFGGALGLGLALPLGRVALIGDFRAVLVPRREGDWGMVPLTVGARVAW
ncbi:MAG: hypothetical protein NW201_03665 [Gemmatimonadales bacterium]|nr:hypothetical protein [Gemmatimonadales bacterium]